MKSETTYYAIVANNGLAVVNEWFRVEKAGKYFRGENNKGYKCKEEAIMAARANYNDRHEYAKYYGEIEVNKLYFTKNFTPKDMTQPYPVSMVIFQE